MTPDALVPSDRPHPVGTCGPCEVCGSAGGGLPLLEVPVPVELIERLGLPQSPSQPVRWLCAECVGKGLQGHKLDLLALVKLAPLGLKQEIHAYLMQVFEI